MCYRIAKLTLIVLAVASTVALLVPWQMFSFIPDEEAAHYLSLKLALMPLPAFFLLGALWAAGHAAPRRVQRRHG